MMKTIKQIKLIAIVMIMATAFTACKKDKSVTPPLIEGTWVGETKINGVTSPLNFTVKSGKVNWSVSTGFGGMIAIEGTYTLDNTIFTGKRPIEEENNITYTATFNSTTGKLTAGNIKDAGNNNIGTWEATKQ